MECSEVWASVDQPSLIEIRIFSSTRSAPPVMTGEVPATLRVASARPHGAGAQPVSSEG